MTRTLGYGLSVGMQNRMAEIHVVIFLVRRLFLAISLVYAYDSPAIGISLLLASSFGMLSLLAIGNLWDESWIALQHFVNEIAIVLLCLTYLVMSNAFQPTYKMVDDSTHFILAFVIILLTFNFAILVYDVWRHLRIHLKRMRAIIAHRRTRYTI